MADVCSAAYCDEPLLGAVEVKRGRCAAHPVAVPVIADYCVDCGAKLGARDTALPGNTERCAQHHREHLRAKAPRVEPTVPPQTAPRAPGPTLSLPLTDRHRQALRELVEHFQVDPGDAVVIVDLLEGQSHPGPKADWARLGILYGMVPVGKLHGSPDAIRQWAVKLGYHRAAGVRHG